MQEPKPKAAPQPVPQLSRAPARPASAVTEAATAADSAPGSKSPDRSFSRNTKAAVPRPVSEILGPPESRQAAARPAGQAAETLEATASAAKADVGSKATPRAAIESKPLPQLRQAPVRPTLRALEAGDTIDTAGLDKQSSAQAEGPGAFEAPLPQASPTESAQEVKVFTESLQRRATSQVSAAADGALPEPSQAAPAASKLAPEPVPAPQRPNKPRPPAMQSEAPPTSAASQRAESPSSPDEAISTLAIRRSEAAQPAAKAPEASATAPPEEIEMLEPIQVDGAGGAASFSAAGGEGAPAKVGASTMPQKDGIGAPMQAAPPVAMPKPALPAAQPDQTGREEVAAGLTTWLQDLLQVAQETRASVKKLPGVAIGASYGGVMVQTDAGIRGFLPFAQMLPERQEQIRQSFDARGLPEDLEVSKLRQEFAKTMETVVVTQRVEVYVLSCKVIEKPDPSQQRRNKAGLRSVFSEVTPENDTPPIKTRPPSAAAAKILRSYLGQVISGSVAHLADRYAILHFEVQLENGELERVPGLLHSNDADIANLMEGQVVETVLESVTIDSRGLRLSGTGDRPDLQQTIEDVVSGQSTAKERMGTLPAVELLCQTLKEQEGVLETIPGRRLQGTAFAPEIQVFLSKSEPDAEDEIGAGSGTAQRYTLLARSGNEVQEVAVLASLSREAMKSVLSVALSGIMQYAS